MIITFKALLLVLWRTSQEQGGRCGTSTPGAIGVSHVAWLGESLHTMCNGLLFTRTTLQELAGDSGYTSTHSHGRRLVLSNGGVPQVIACVGVIHDEAWSIVHFQSWVSNWHNLLCRNEAVVIRLSIISCIFVLEEVLASDDLLTLQSGLLIHVTVRGN